MSRSTLSLGPRLQPGQQSINCCGKMFELYGKRDFSGDFYILFLFHFSSLYRKWENFANQNISIFEPCPQILIWELHHRICLTGTTLFHSISLYRKLDWYLVVMRIKRSWASLRDWRSSEPSSLPPWLSWSHSTAKPNAPNEKGRPNRF